MVNILDRFTRTHQFQPKSPEDLFAIRLAARLKDEDSGEHYAGLLTKHSQERLATLLKKVLETETRGDMNLAQRFHFELQHHSGHGSAAPSVRLLAIKTERRSVAGAVFAGDQLDYTQVRHLSSTGSKAEASAFGFISWMLTEFEVESVAIESVNGKSGARRSQLNKAAIRSVRELGLPIWEMSKRELFRAFTSPPVNSRKEIRRISELMWPFLNGGTGHDQILDAAALGTLVQVERKFL